MNRELTGNWYIKKGWFSMTIFVEVSQDSPGPDRFGPDAPRFTKYVKATDSDIANLNIKIL